MKVTMYFRSEFGMGVKRVEATLHEVSVRQYAQYERGVYARFTPKRMRKERHLVQAYGPSLVILEGWGHPEPDGMFLPAVPSSTNPEDVMVSRGRYSACDPRWQSDFDAKLAAHVESTKAKVLFDFRGHEPGCRGMVGACPCKGCSAEVPLFGFPKKATPPAMMCGKCAAVGTNVPGPGAHSPGCPNQEAA